MGRRADQDAAAVWQRVRIGKGFIVAFEARSSIDHVANDGVFKPIIAPDASGSDFPCVDSRPHADGRKSSRLPVARQLDQPPAHCKSAFDRSSRVTRLLRGSRTGYRHTEECQNSVSSELL